MPKTKTGATQHPRSYRSAAAPWLTGALLVLAVVVMVAGWGRSPAQHVAATLAGTAVGLAGYALYWRPRLEIHEDSVWVINPVRTIAIPWAQLVDVHTRWALTLVTAQGSYSCFALPSAGASAALRSDRKSVERAHPIARSSDGSVRVGDLTSTASGAAAHQVRTLWQHKVETGELDIFRPGGLEQEPVVVRYTPAPLATAAIAAVASAALYMV